jgi:hypothetical protein
MKIRYRELLDADGINTGAGPGTMEETKPPKMVEVLGMRDPCERIY